MRVTLVLVLIVLGILGTYFYLTATTFDTPAAVLKSEPGWETATDTVSGTRFMYPKEIGTTYMSTVEWPPRVGVSTETFACVESGDSPVAGTVVTATLLSPGTPACVTRSSEGAAGSTYRTYAYTIPQSAGSITFTFTLRYPQCLNYDEPQQRACLAEQEMVDVDALVARMYATLSR